MNAWCTCSSRATATRPDSGRARGTVARQPHMTATAIKASRDATVMCGRAQPCQYALSCARTADGTRAGRPRPRRQPRAPPLLRRGDARQPGPSHGPLRLHHIRRPHGANGARAAQRLSRPPRPIRGRRPSKGRSLQQTRAQGRTARSPSSGSRRPEKLVGAAAAMKGSRPTERTRTCQGMSAQALRAPTDFDHGSR